MSTFSKMMKSSSDLKRLSAEIDKLDAGARNIDERFWKPDIDKAGNGSAIIRFLPGAAVDGDDALPFVRYFHHAFKGNKGWYFENSLTTFKEPDPCSEYNGYLWNLVDDKKSPHRIQARKQKRKLSYVSNILVISDPRHPENNGMVRLYEYGKQIFSKITDLMNPEFEGDQPISPFHFMEGCNFKMIIKKDADSEYPTYNSSKFDNPSVLFVDKDGNPDEKKMEEVWNKEFSLLEFLDRKRFKTYDELKKRLDMVMGFDTANPPGHSSTAVSRVSTSKPSEADEDDDDDIESRFKKFAQDD